MSIQIIKRELNHYISILEERRRFIDSALLAFDIDTTNSLSKLVALRDKWHEELYPESEES
jgi:hypothetical protein